MTITTTAQPTRLPADAGAPGNLAAHLAALAERRGWTGRPAFHQGHRAYSHGEVHDLAARTATVLADHGVRPGDRVLLALPDSVTWVTTFRPGPPGRGRGPGEPRTHPAGTAVHGRGHRGGALGHRTGTGLLHPGAPDAARGRGPAAGPRAAPPGPR
ncbi:AMP-binding protein, partial [Streptomyces scabiei]|uniref:AMP-binding protein n=1 Tax=Streptomyces scabiei TaxID=1930 RepID=UPI0038D40891